TAIFPHYSLLEGHDRFDRLPSNDTRFKPLHRDTCSFPTPIQLLRQLGALQWFVEPELVADKRYAVEKEALSLPTVSLGLIDRREVGPKRVYDISVEGVHAFVAGTIAVSNCIGNSGPLPEPVAQGITSGNLVAAAVLSGNRNFEGRVNPHTRAN